MKFPIPAGLFVIWCLVVLLAFAVATSDGYSAFATAGRPTPVNFAAGQRHK